jgi:3-deoxy-D-manno-octulosonic acid kinase
MMTDGGRIATDNGAMLADSARVGNAGLAPSPQLFDPAFWSDRKQCSPAQSGRGSAWFVGPLGAQWVLRHYRRGGLIARLSNDKYWWYGEHRVRAFAEWRLLEGLHRRGLPVPKPIAAAYRRSGATYQCDLLTERIDGARSLSALLEEAPLGEAGWRKIGATIKQLHVAGVFHADLNAHNILLGPEGKVSVIDFDRGRLREPGPWTQQNLARLRRSLRKISRQLPAESFGVREWRWLLAGYA